MRNSLILFFFIFFVLYRNAVAQTDSLSFFAPSPSYNSLRLKSVIISEGTVYAGSVTALNLAWYKGYNKSSFHFFNDNREWLQMDKIGHLAGTYNLGNTGIHLLRWAGVTDTKAIWYGGLLGSVYMLNIEVLDGYSSGWGFSWGDLAANTMGSGLVIGEELLWKEQRINIKYSYHQSNYINYRPQLLGENLAENMLKDYNGQTFWMSFNIHSFLNKSSRFPKWLNVALGYGAEGMTGGKENSVENNGITIPVFERYRKYYLSLDIDLTRIKTRYKFMNAVFHTFGFLKIPAPAIEYNSQNRFVFHPFYF